MSSGDQGIRIRLKSHDYRNLDATVAEILKTAQRTGSVAVGPIPLPMRISKFTVLRSPHIDKKARDQFEMRVYKRVLEIHACTTKTVEELKKLDLPSGVNIEVRVIGKG